MSILSILNELAADNSRLAKEAILLREENNQLLKAVLVAALDPYINYYQKKIPAYKPEGKPALSWALDGLTELKTRAVTGNAAIMWLQNILSSLDKSDAEVIERIIGRDLKCGVSDSTVNKIWPGLIPTFDVMTCHKDTSGIKFPAFAQTKMDGARCHLFFDGKNATAFARSGKEFKLFGALDEAARVMMESGETFDGELLFTDANGKILDRKTSNGIANKANKGTISDEEARRAIFVVWDIVDFTSTIPYSNRLTTLNVRFRDAFQAQLKTNIHMVKNVVVNSHEEAIAFYDGERKLGEEGAILKNMSTLWVPKRTKDQGKMKAEEEADLEVIGWELGTGKNSERMGNLVCATSDRKLVVGVGTGFSDEEREKGFTIGSIVTVRYNEIIKDKKSDTFSLFLPRFIERRFDKKVANKFEELK